MELDIMNRDILAAQWKAGELQILDEDALPLYLLRTRNVEHWLEIRAIDSHRAHSRLLKKALRLEEKDDVSTVLSVNGANITDSYWVKAPDSTLRYRDVRFDHNYFARLSLTGNYSSFNRAASIRNSRTPELTNIGSFEKCWKLVDGQWWMYKKANHNEQFSELFAYHLGSALGMNMAEYQRCDDHCIMTRDFTGGASVNYEPAYSFIEDNEDYIETVEALKKLCPEAVPDYVRMIYLDTLIANPDRHPFNFGILRNAESGKITGLAPNFDNNLALISRGYPGNVKRRNDLLAELLNTLLVYDADLRKHLPELTEAMVREVIGTLNMKVRSQVIIDFVMNAFRQIER